MKIGAVIIGDELLSGKRQDKHFAYVQQALAKRGLELSWTVIVGDEAEQLQRFLTFTLNSDDLVFCFGGIGATPDDRTRQTVAKVLEVELLPHPDAIAEIEGQFGNMAYPKRILMAELPVGSSIIPNPVNRVPGFTIKYHHFMPGFPEMSWPMLEWILDTHYPHIKNLAPEVERVIYIQTRESELLDSMLAIEANYPAVRLSSLPRIGANPIIEFSLRGPSTDVEIAMNTLIQALDTQGISWSNQDTAKN